MRMRHAPVAGVVAAAVLVAPLAVAAQTDGRMGRHEEIRLASPAGRDAYPCRRARRPP